MSSNEHLCINTYSIVRYIIATTNSATVKTTNNREYRFNRGCKTLTVVGLLSDFGRGGRVEWIINIRIRNLVHDSE